MHPRQTLWLPVVITAGTGVEGKWREPKFANCVRAMIATNRRANMRQAIGTFSAGEGDWHTKYQLSIKFSLSEMPR
jgi:hypothetical protein